MREIELLELILDRLNMLDGAVVWNNDFEFLRQSFQRIAIYEDALRKIGFPVTLTTPII